MLSIACICAILSLPCVLVTGSHLHSPYNQVDIRVRVKGGGTSSQIYAIRQAIAKGIVAYYQKCKYTCNRVM